MSFVFSFVAIFVSQGKVLVMANDLGALNRLRQKCVMAYIRVKQEASFLNLCLKGIAPCTPKVPGIQGQGQPTGPICLFF